MARATTKADLTASANGQFDKMWKLIDSMSEEQQKAAFAEEMATAGKETHWSRDKNLRDVLVHLYEWHQLADAVKSAFVVALAIVFITHYIVDKTPANARRGLQKSATCRMALL